MIYIHVDLLHLTHSSGHLVIEWCRNSTIFYFGLENVHGKKSKPKLFFDIHIINIINWCVLKLFEKLLSWEMVCPLYWMFSLNFFFCVRWMGFFLSLLLTYPCMCTHTHTHSTHMRMHTHWFLCHSRRPLILYFSTVIIITCGWLGVKGQIFSQSVV